jgi:hypothetical protein
MEEIILMTQITSEMRQCINACLSCYASCRETKSHCLDMGGKHAAREHQTLLSDCAEACFTSADFMLRGSKHHQRYCEICAELCQDCARDCERMAGGDQTMLRCVESCRQCADTCRRMAHAMA